ncbi:glucose-1-phosphate thymidylyltransferase [Thermococcus sp. GR7]|uniref:bifunctional sugar-1-phosphate nucleotidylyltransferase/acetyltransferase n=1 Tax=unclassified Thermococcus TaxID=2627626 RepID=UPI001431F783|nr:MULTISPECIES: bifunctional sugar-1-phosphate nucleotidylyltransferase/acetyltransferase [unclassified Thermococcus]NJE46342.1 glucose-1-phosphate thymidylyltransferase [Thermococcus sp. GR7]NJE77739.1 glucose-1-phosphate thymidylyltransferase [Thermococcus sp. GR4]NJF23779.1 glucose-1-phosphate thymidylyltransferase [Thermococcus sp. GR5]
MKAVVLAAGKGERLRPLTDDRPKVVLKVANRPIVEYVLENLDPFVDEFILIVRYQKEKLIETLGDEFNGKPITYVDQLEGEGTAKAIESAKDYIEGEEFIVANGDIYFEIDGIKELIQAFKKEKADAAVLVKEFEDLSHFGKIEVDGNLVKAVLEKPGKVSGYANLGVYIFKPDVFEFISKTPLSKRGEYEITDTLNLMIKAGKKVTYAAYSGYWNDVGRPWNLIELNEYLLKNKLRHEIKGIVEEGATLVPPVEIGEGTIIRSGAYIIGPVKIGRNSRIGPNCFIRPYTSIGDNCHIGNAVEVKNSIIMDHSNAPHLNYVGDSIIGENTNLGAGTITANLRHDKGNIKVEIKGKLEDSGRRKLGAIIGHNVKVGINVTIYPGRKIGSNSFVGPGVVVDKNIPSNSLVVVRQEKVVMER